MLNSCFQEQDDITVESWLRFVPPVALTCTPVSLSVLIKINELVLLSCVVGTFTTC